MAKFAILFVCILVAVGLMLAVPVEYRFATIAVLVAMAIIDAIADDSQKRRILQFARNSIAQILRPPLSFILWLGDVASDVSPLPSLKPFKRGLSRAELKQHWADSWMTAPARYWRSLNRGK